MRGALAPIGALFGGAALALAFPEPDVTLLAWLAVAPLLVGVRRATIGGGAALGFVFGCGFFGLLLAWISLVGWLAWGLLVLLQSSFLALFGAGAALTSRLPRAWMRIVAPATIWVAIEYLRSIFPAGGFTWGQLAQSQHSFEWILRSGALAGAWLVAFLVLVVNTVVAESVSVRPWRWRAAVPIVTLVAVVFAIPTIHRPRQPTGRPMNVAIVQGNVPEQRGASAERTAAMIRRHLLLTQSLRDEPVDLVVWPESALPLDAEGDPGAQEVLERAASAVAAPMIVGGNVDVDADHYLVVAFHVDEAGRVVDRYQKTHLVPFGEYVPGRGLLGAIPLLDQVPRDALAGREKKLFDLVGGSVAPVISFEGDFGSLVRERIALGGRLLVVATNTSTWGRSWASAQHLAMSQVRAAENGVWVVHAALSGISAFVRPDGSVSAATDLWEATTLTESVRFASSTTPYARWGDWFAYASLIAAVASVVAGSRPGNVRG